MQSDRVSTPAPSQMLHAHAEGHPQTKCACHSHGNQVRICPVCGVHKALAKLKGLLSIVPVIAIPAHFKIFPGLLLCWVGQVWRLQQLLNAQEDLQSTVFAVSASDTFSI